VTCIEYFSDDGKCGIEVSGAKQWAVNGIRNRFVSCTISPGQFNCSSSVGGKDRITGSDGCSVGE